jgi:C-terminal processing protease CtpA/Prc
MRKLVLAAIVVILAWPAWADNPMGYRLITQQDAMRLPHNGGSLGMDIAAAERINESRLTFDLIRVKSVKRGSPAQEAGIRSGAEIIAVDGQVFESLRAFASYVASVSPGERIMVDYIPSGGGPKDAQRVPIQIGSATQAQPKEGMSTGKKIAIGVGAAALLGCYEIGCFSKK